MNEMPRKISSGLLMYKFEKGKLKVFLVHLGGPFWKNKDENAWSIPKGEVDGKDDGNLLETAKREFWEETGISPPSENSAYIELGKIQYSSTGKIVNAFAFEGDWNGLLVCRSYVALESPPQSGKYIKFPEVDKAGFFNLEDSKNKVIKGQISFLEILEEKLKNHKK